jgi:DNA replication protein DnaC
MSPTGDRERVQVLLKELHLPGVRDCFVQKAEEAVKQGLSIEGYLREILEVEWTERRLKGVQRRRRESKLPLEKTFATLQMDRMDRKLRHQVDVLKDGDFLKRKENVLVFGRPGTGKTHLLAALGHELIQQGFRVAFVTCSLLVQELLRAKTQLQLDKYINKLSAFDALILDDIGYVQQSRDEMEVLFTLLAARYERGSVLLTSNLPFSKWESIFKDPMTTAAAIDRLVHHSVILELNLSSYRMEQASQRNKSAGGQKS